MVRPDPPMNGRPARNRGAVAASHGKLLFLICVVLAIWPAGRGLSQMTEGHRPALPARPLPPGLKAPELRIDDIAATAGLKGVNVSGSDKQQIYIVENTGTGVALFDFDNDGLPDIFLVNADRFDRTGPAPGHFLYRNLGGLRFEDVTSKSGISHTDWGQGVCAGDVDNDGKIDLFVTSWGRNHLWRNQGNSAFRDETTERGLGAATRWSTGCAFLDYDRDGHLDLFVAHYVEFHPDKIRKPTDADHCSWKGFPVVCGPIGLPPETMSLYHNDGRGNFTEVTEQSGVGKSKGIGLSVLTGDFDNDGWPDIYVACDSTPNLYFINQHDGTFQEGGAMSALAYNEDGREQSGMGASAADYDHNGFLDIAKTNFSDDVPNLYRNIDGSIFNDVTAAAGLAAHSQFVSWGIAFLDADNDGWKDMLIVNGHVYPDIDGRGVGHTFRQQRLLYWNRRDGQFFDMSPSAGPGILTPHSSRGLAIGDMDNDGIPEAVVVNMHEAPSLLKISGGANNSLLIQALAGGRDAIGARLEVSSGGMTQVDEVRSGGYYISQGDFRVLFGLARETKADITVRWPDGKHDVYRGVIANQRVVIEQGKGIKCSPLTQAKGSGLE